MPLTVKPRLRRLVGGVDVGSTRSLDMKVTRGERKYGSPEAGHLTSS
jgi:hypothetical protein